MNRDGDIAAPWLIVERPEPPMNLKMKFSLAVSGNGRLMPRFVQALKLRYPQITIYDRNEEANRPPSNAPIPSHPKVADIEVVFTRSGARETATIRNRKEHRFFNYVSDPKAGDDQGLNMLLKQMVQAVEALL